ncbi:MAG: tRNA (adenosine(37)-N6)-dimethylallyltransferase MiaA [Desulfuromonadales bacterium]
MADDKRLPLIVICGPTAAGKTDIALRLGEKLPLEVISADSRQVYRRLDIGTAKPTVAELARLPHHLIDLIEPEQSFTAAAFSRLGRQAAASIAGHGKIPVVVGGTGLYIRTLTEGLVEAPAGDEDLRRELLRVEAAEGEGTLYRRLQAADPEIAARLSPRDRVRIVRALEVQAITGRRFSDLQREHAFADQPFRILKIGATLERSELYRRIDQRTETMLAAGLVEEVRELLDCGIAPACKGLQTIGYREVVNHLGGGISLAEAVALIQRDTRRYAKRQLTWFRNDREIIWVDSLREFGRIQQLIENFMQNKRSGHG